MRLKTKSCSLLMVVTLTLITLLSGCTKAARQKRSISRGDNYYAQGQYAKAEIEYLNALRAAPDDLGLLRKLSDVFYEQGRVIGAIRLLKTVQEKAPNDPDIRFKLADLLFQSRDYSGARQEVVFVAGNQPTNVPAMQLLADTSVSPSDLQDARTILERLANQGGNAASHLALSSLDVRQGRLTSAEDHLRKASALHPSEVDLNLAWVRLRLAQTNLVEAEALLKKVFDSPRARPAQRLRWVEFQLARGEVALARKVLEEISDRQPEYLPTWHYLATIALGENRYDDCDKFTKRAISYDKQDHRALLLRSRMWMNQGRMEESMVELKRLEGLLPENPAVKYEMALALARDGEISQALALANEAVRLVPDFAEAKLLQAKLLLRSGNAPAAVAPLQDLLRAKPELKEAGALLASIYVSLGRPDDAISIYREAAARFPKDPTPLTAMGLVLLSPKRDLAGARAAFEKSLAVSPTYVVAVEQLVGLDLRAKNYPAALARAGKLQRDLTNSAAGYLFEARVQQAVTNLPAAEAALLKAVSREPDSATAFALLADLYVKRNEPEKAFARLDEVIQRSTNAFAAWTQKGILYEQRGQRDKAIDCYERALVINTNYHFALNNLAALLAQNPGKLDQALSFAARANQLLPGQPDFMDTLGWIHFLRRDYTQARRLLSDAANSVANPETHYHAARADYAAGDVQGAQRRFAQALGLPGLSLALRQDVSNRLAVLRVNPATASDADVKSLEKVAGDDSEDFLAHFQLATIRQLRGAKDKAIASFETAAQANPQSAQPHLALARLQAQTDLKAALQHAQTARKLAPTDPTVAGVLGSLSLRNHEYKAALVLFQEAQKSGALKRPQELFDFSLAQFAAGQVSVAQGLLSEILAGVQPDAPIVQSVREAQAIMAANAPNLTDLAEARLKADSRDLLGLYGLAEAGFRGAKGKKTLELYEKILSEAPDFGPAHGRLAFLYLEGLDDANAAYPHALKAVALRPSDSELALLMGKIHFKRKSLNDAITYLQSAAPRQSNGEPYYLLGVANLSLRRTNEAKAALMKATTLPLKEDMVREANRLLLSVE